MARATINVGMIGYKFMGKAHSNAYNKLNMFFDPGADVVRRTLCGRDAAALEEARLRFGWQESETDWTKLVRREDIDLIDITTPSKLHPEMAIGAAEAGKHILCEKPLAAKTGDARKILEAARKAGIKHQVGFNYRFAPAIRLARQMIDAGKLGKIFHFRGSYLQQYLIDPDFPKVWRLDKSVAGSGAHGDLGAHVIDLARYLVGDLDRVVGVSKTFIKERPEVGSMSGLSATVKGNAPMAAVDVDDATSFLGEFKNGALCNIEATRYMQGHANDLSFEISGEKGALRFSLERINELEFYDATAEAPHRGFALISVTDGGVHPYWDAWWPGGHVIGYEHTFIHEIYELVKAIQDDSPTSPDFYDGFKCTQILEAVDASIENCCWVSVDSL